MDETPLVGDLAADEGPVIVPDDAVVAAEAAREIPPRIVSDAGLTTVDDMIMTGPLGGYRKSELERSKIGEETDWGGDSEDPD